MDQNPSNKRLKRGPRKRTARSRAEGVTTPARLLTLDDLDRRSTACRYALALKDGFVSDLGGFDNTTVAQRELAQRASILGAMLEDTEVKWLRGDPIQLGEYCTLVNAQRRVLSDIGLERRQRDVTPALSQYLAVKVDKKEDELDE